MTVVWGSGACAGELVLRPSISLGEEFTDNIFEDADGRKSEFITRVRPSAAVGYRAPFGSLDASYLFEYRKYAKGTHGDENWHNLDFKVTSLLIDNFAYVDVIDSLHRTTTNVARDVETESPLVNQTTQNVLSISPFIVWRPTEKGTLKTGYSYSETRYWQGTGLNRREQAGFAELQHLLSEKVMLYGSYTFTRGDASITSYDRHDVMGGFRYSYADNCFLFGRVGNSWQHFSGGTSVSNMIWDAGVSHDFRGVSALLESKVQNVNDPLSISTRQVSHTGRLDKPFARGAVGLSSTYAEYYITKFDQLEHRRLTIAGTGRYDVRPRLSLSTSVTADRFSHNTDTDYPYRLTASGGVNYGFYNDSTSLSLSYIYRIDRKSLGSPTGEKATNRIIIEAIATY